MEELSGKCKALSSGVQAAAIDVGPRRVAQARRSSMPNPARCNLTAAAGVASAENNSTTEASARESGAEELTLKLWINSLVDAVPVRTTSSGGVFHFSRSFVSFDLLVEAHRRSRRSPFFFVCARRNKLREFQRISDL
jgi:hypothetical protein